MISGNQQARIRCLNDTTASEIVLIDAGHMVF
jgi:hypothetical protein